MKEFDFVVVGSGVAGLSLALKLSAHGTVAIFTKNAVQESNTNYAQGGVACVTSTEDSFELHVRDTLQAGAGLCDEGVVRTIIAEGPARIRELMELGVKFTERENSITHELDLGKEGGHSKRRILHAGDITGREIERGLLSAVKSDSRIKIFEHSYVIDLITSAKLGFAGENRCLGLYVLDSRHSTVQTVRSAVTILGTGGCGKCYLYTTNPSIATADGVAIAYRAGAEVANMEFIQFHPTCLYHPRNQSFLISEALRGEGGIIVNRGGEDFTKKYDPRGSLAPRDIVARAIDAEMKAKGAECVYLDIRKRGKSFIQSRFPNIYETCLSLGIDAAEQPIPVVPAAHYQCGGIKTRLDGSTTLTGLYAVGEVACTGLHGANRLASNSLLEAVVMAHRTMIHAVYALEHLRHDTTLPPWHEGDAHDPDELVVITHNWREIRQIMWDYVGIVRTNKRLQRAATRLQLLADEVRQYYWDFKVTGDLLELRNLSLVTSLIVDSAMTRKESRGLHYTTDYPETLPEAKGSVRKISGVEKIPHR